MSEGLAGDAWFAGFAAGEAYFGIFRRLRGDRMHYVPVFSIGLRLDDAGILEELQACFGGSLSTVKEPTGGGNPQGRWDVHGRRENAELVKYFDRFPLRAKKAGDFAVWRSAVLAYVREGGYAPEMPALHLALTEGRRFDGGTVTAITTPQAGPDRTYTLNNLKRYCQSHGYPEEAKAVRRYTNKAYHRYGTSVIGDIPAGAWR